MKVRTRIAPSPTGFVHIGTIHNALFAHALAKKYNGQFILRIEDTDQRRYVKGANEEVYKMLDEFGLTPDEGPKQGGPFAPYIQSERLKLGIYKNAVEDLIKNGHAYYCFLSEKELKEIKGGQIAKKKGGFRSPYRDSSEKEALKRLEKGEKYVIRLKVPNNEEIKVNDAILGEIKWNSNDIDDQVLIKSDGFPTYQLAVVVDDHIMQISHITRAYEWLPSTPKQILIYKYLGWDMPIFAHSSLVLDPHGGKLSKRKGTVSARQFLQEGYLVDAILNFLMLLGWSAPIDRKPGEKEREIFSHEEFIQLYELEDRHKHNAIFDRNKLIWFNQQYIKMKPVAELAQIFIKWLKNYSIEKSFLTEIEQDQKNNNLEKKLVLVNERAKTLIDIYNMIKPFYETPKEINLEIKQLTNIRKKIVQTTKRIIALITTFDENSDKWSKEKWVDGMRVISNELNVKFRDVFMVERVALWGNPVSPPLFECSQILGKEKVLIRLKRIALSSRH